MLDVTSSPAFGERACSARCRRRLAAGFVSTSFGRELMRDSIPPWVYGR